LQIAAVNVGKTDTALGAFYRRLAASYHVAAAMIADTNLDCELL
jgi:hypothetical protein